MKMTIGKIGIAALVRAAGQDVETIKQASSPRCLFEFDDSRENRRLIEAYETGLAVPVSQKAIWDAYIELVAETKRMQAGRIGGFAL